MALACTALLACLARATAAAPSGAPDATPRLTLSAGWELEGRREELGYTTLLDVTQSETATAQADSARYRERETALLFIAGIAWQPRIGPAWRSRWDLDTRWGRSRRGAMLNGEAACDSGRWAGFALRELVLWDDDEGGEAGVAVRSAQNLLNLKWRAPRAIRGWKPRLGVGLDLSGARALEAETDSLAGLYADFLNYQRVSLRAGLERGGLGGARVELVLARKWMARAGSGAYTAGALEGLRSWWGGRRLIDLDLRLERRDYAAGGDGPDTSSLSLSSYWESEGGARWQQEWGRAEVTGQIRLTGTLYDEAPEVELEADPSTSDAESSVTASLSTLNADRLRITGELLLSREVVLEAAGDLGGEGGSPPPWMESVRWGAGGECDLLWVRGGEGDFRGLGAKLALGAHAGPRLGGAWLDASLAAGWRTYRNGDETLSFDLEGIAFSLAQTDYAYVELSLIGGGRLPAGLEWEVYVALDREAHAQAADDLSLFSVDLTLTRRWDVAR